MSNHPLEARLDILIRLLENLPRKICEELERREVLHEFEKLQLVIEEKRSRMETHKK
jgi:hypothetical protein